MPSVQIIGGNVRETIYSSDVPITATEIGCKVTQITGLAANNFYILHNGRLARGDYICENGTANVVPRLLGGKGGFGSMLRAIGAQIEKTTNREACRDLSGRRLRDINEEKRLKSWIDKQATREEEAVERKKKKLERLCAQPKHEFKDKNYEKERSTLTSNAEDAIEAGFKLAMEGSSGVKRKAEEKPKHGRKKLVLDIDMDMNSDELGSSSDESDADSNSTSPSNTKRQSTSSSSSPTLEVSCTEHSKEVKSNDATAVDHEDSKTLQLPVNEELEKLSAPSDVDSSNCSTKSVTDETLEDVSPRITEAIDKVAVSS